MFIDEYLRFTWLYPMKHKSLGSQKYFLGIEIESHSESLILHQKSYVKDILHQAAMSDCNPMPTPLPQRI